MNRFFLLCSMILVLSVMACNARPQEVMATNERSAPDDHLTDLIRQMTIEEKVGQMTQLNLDVVLVGEIYQSVEPHHIDTAALRHAIVDKHAGSMLNVGGHAYSLTHWRELMTAIQGMAVDESRLKIPIVYGIDAIHGANYLTEGTLFPQPLAQAATFDVVAAEEVARITAYETRATGVPWNFSPVLDVGRQPLWSRMFETYGEDVHLCTEMGRASVRGYQGEDASDPYRVSACMKHFLGYSIPFSGKDRTAVYIHDRQLREYFLPTFEAAIEEGALTVMINSGELNGVPVHADKDILTDLLRNELGFDGVAVTDWEDIIKLRDNHRVAATLKEAVKMAVMAGIDMSMTPNDYSFTDLLIELVKEGEVPESRLDESVYRILLMKERLGLFDTPLSYTENDYPLVGSNAHDETNLAVARDAMTLLKNEGGLLPLDPASKILVTGPAAHSMTMLNGAWSRTWQGTDSQYDDEEKQTILEAMSEVFSKELDFVDACTIDSYDADSLSRISEMASTQDCIVVCLGELPSTEKPGDIDDLELEGAQIDLVKELATLGRPIVAVLVENRPRLISEIEPLLDAILMAYQPGDEGGMAIADVLSGRISPSGRLPLTYPRHANTLLTYDHKQTDRLAQDFSMNAFDPQYEFGHGLSYADISYGPITLSTDTLRGSDTLRIGVSITNKKGKSDYTQKESVLLFVSDRVASITPPVKRLKSFQKVTLEPGQSSRIQFCLSSDDLRFVGKDSRWIVEEGWFDVEIAGERKAFYYMP